MFFEKELKTEFFSVKDQEVKDYHVIFAEAKHTSFPVFLWLFFGLLILFAFCIVVFFVYYLRKKMRKKTEISEDSLLGEETPLGHA